MSDLQSRIVALENKVKALCGHSEIQELRFRYHIAINESVPEAIPPLFSELGEIDFGHLGKAKGHTEINSFYQRALSELVPFVKQFIHNHSIQIDGDTGTGLSYLEAKPIYNGESYLVAARFDDEYIRERGQWKFKKMILSPFFMVPLHTGWAGEKKIQMGWK